MEKQGDIGSDEFDEKVLSVKQRLRKAIFWGKSSYFMVCSLFLLGITISYFWWPLAERYLSQIDWNGEWWLQLDYLLLGDWLFMTVMILLRADLRNDLPIIVVGFFGGLYIESWGTQTEMWRYYTKQRPPLWIIPAWPVANLTIDRMVVFADILLPKAERLFRALYWLIFSFFLMLMVGFVWPTIDRSLTLTSLFLCVLTILTPSERHRISILHFLGGTGLGYFLELWGTSRRCWIYYTEEVPPTFAVFAHGMAAVGFWRGVLLFKTLCSLLLTKIFPHQRSTWSQRSKV